MSHSHESEIRKAIDQYGLSGRITFENRWITEDEKVERLAPALAVAYLPVDEDSYGYSSLEAAHAQKAILTTTDSGGVLELVEHEANGLVVPPIPQAIAEAMDRLYRDRSATVRMGAANERKLSDLNIDWSTVVDALTS
jgi:glycosyltransferase involved in cell wall biosynthesis